MSHTAFTDRAALEAFVVNSRDFDRLKALLGGFNIFDVLRFAEGEIRHSNMLGWILDPTQSHGLGQGFLRNWLKRVLHEASTSARTSLGPIDVECAKFSAVEVRREWMHIDLLLVLSLPDDDQWVVAIENKVGSRQHSHQLPRYREKVDAAFPRASRRVHLFLTRDEEEPEDDAYHRTSYTTVHQALQEALDAAGHSVGSQPRVLLENYLRLLEEKFMDDSEIAQIARRLYQQHRRALDVIFEHRPDAIRLVTDTLHARLQRDSDELGILLEGCTKGIIRFIPIQWNHVGNSHGAAWPKTNRTVLIEFSIKSGKAYLSVIAGKAPDAWMDRAWARAASAPFNKRRSRKDAERPRDWCFLHAPAGDRPIVDDEAVDSDEEAQRLYDWIASFLREPATRSVIEIIAGMMDDLQRASLDGDQSA